MKSRNGMLLLLASAITILPLLIVGNAEFSGSDGQAQDLIDGGGYEPWFEPLWEPPSGEIESLLFSLQAALGAGLLGYYIGLRKGRREEKGRVERSRGERAELHAGD
jgi:cobalt/nickel transport protein